MDRIEIDGVTLHEGGPIGNVAFRVEPGVDVLYGRNGAGKSILLRRVADALACADRPFDDSELGGESFVHARIVEVDSDDFQQEFGDTDEFDGQSDDPEFTPDQRLASRIVATLADGRPADPWQNPAERGLRLPEAAAAACRRYLEAQVRTEVVGYLHDREESDAPTAEQIDRWVQAASLSDRVAFRTGGGALLFTALRLDEVPPESRADFETAVFAGSERLRGGLDDLAATIADYGDPPDIPWLAQHPWASVPWLNSGPFPDVVLSRVIELGDESDLDALTCEALYTTVQSSLDRVGDFAKCIAISADGSYRIASPLAEAVQSFTALANDVYRHLLIDAPLLRLALTPPKDVFLGARFFTWRGLDPSDAEVPLCKLSAAQRRWARFSVNVALGLFTRSDSWNSEGGPTVLVVDEPEVALHPTGQRFLAAGFVWLAESFAITIVAASHSVAFLAPAQFRLHHVSRGLDGRVELDALPSAFALDSATLGVDQADLLALTRVIMIVEGRHDELVLRELFDRKLRDAGVTVLAARGGSGLESVTEAQLLFDSTDAHILAVVDNVDGAAVAGTVAAAFDLAAGNERQAAIAFLDANLDSKVSEQKYVKEFASRAVDRGREDRVSVWGLTAPDVLDYLPVRALCRGKRARGKSWGELRNERGADPKPRDNFKEWAREQLAFNDDDETIINAVRSLDPVPDDLTDLLNEAIRLAHLPWGGHFAPTDEET